MSKSVSWIKEAQKNALKFEGDKINIFVHVVIDKDVNLYNAHCLEFDIVVDGKTIKEVKENILEAIINHVTFCIAYDNMDKILNPAPSEYWNKFFFNSKKYPNPFVFKPNYKYEGTELSFLSNLIPKVEFGKACANA